MSRSMPTPLPVPAGITSRKSWLRTAEAPGKRPTHLSMRPIRSGSPGTQIGAPTNSCFGMSATSRLSLSTRIEVVASPIPLCRMRSRVSSVVA